MRFIRTMLINITIFFILFITFDYSFFKYQSFLWNKTNIMKLYPRYNTFDNLESNPSSTYVYKTFLRDKYFHKPIYASRKKSPIILFGCSFTYFLNDTGLQKLLAEYTNRTVYNFSFWGWGTQHMYYLINDNYLYELITKYNNTDKDPELVIYTYIRDHNLRYNPFYNIIEIAPMLNYKTVDGKLQEKKYNIFEQTIQRPYIVRFYINKFYSQKTSNLKLLIPITYKLILESYKKIKTKYPNIKFIILEYIQDIETNKYEEEMFNKLEKEGIIRIKTKDLSDIDLSSEEYTEIDNFHPNQKAWETLIEPLAQKIENII